jgi:transposase InsO family protein
MSSTLPNFLRSMVEKHPLANDGSNYSDWYLKLCIVLRLEDLLHILDDPEPVAEDPAKPTDTEKETQRKWKEQEKIVQALILATLGDQLQRKFINTPPKETMSQLEKLFTDSARKERYRTTIALARCKMVEGESVSVHFLKMQAYLEKLEKMKSPMPEELAEDLILGSLPVSYKSFVMHHHMREKPMSLNELHNALKTAEADMGKTKESSVLAVASSSKKVAKKRGNTKSKSGKALSSQKGKSGGAQASTSKGSKKKNSPSSETECFYCHEKGHFKMNCPKYKRDLDDGKVESKRHKGMLVIELNLNLATSIQDWVIDTGSCAHLVSNVQALRDRRSLAKGEVVLKVGNGSSISAVTVGSLDLHLSSGLVLNLKNVYHVPSVFRNIISVSCLDAEGFCFEINNSCMVIRKDGLFYANAFISNGLYLLDVNDDKHVLNVNNKRLKSSQSAETLLWHHRLGHINEKRMKKLQQTNLLDSFGDIAIGTCESCLTGKMTKSPFKKKGERAKDLLELIHSDVCGPMSQSARNGYRYFITFTDDYSRYGYVYLMRNKSESFEKFKEYKNEVENQLDKRIKALRTDRGGEYLSNEFSTYLKECGIVPQLTPPGTPQWNGVSERRNRTLLDMVRSMMCQTELPLYFWSYALQTAAHTLNVVPSKSVEKTPHELWMGKPPNITYLRIWGCEAYVKRMMSAKLQPKADKCFFIGYPRETKGYSFWHKLTNTIFVKKGATFLEKEFLERIKSDGSRVTLEEIQEDLQSSDHEMNNDIHDDHFVPSRPPLVSGSRASHQRVEETLTTTPPNVQATRVEEEPIQQEIVEEVQLQRELQEPGEPRRSTRERRRPDFYMGLHEILVVDTEDPLTYEEAIQRDDSKAWREAMESEIQSMYENKVWTLVDLPDGKKAIQNKWVFKRKMDMNGNMTTYKARLVAKGFSQIQGIDYDETFSPVAMFKSIRIMLAIAAFYDYEIWQMDVKTAFLNGKLDEDVYMKQPQGLENASNSKKVCKLQKAIYGLKQASRSWNKRFDEEVKRLGFIQSKEEPCVYKKISGSNIQFLILYVDDILLMGNEISLMEQTKNSLKIIFSMKDMGEAQYILGIKIYRDRSRRLIGLSQCVYIDKILERFRMENSKKGNVPMSVSVQLSKSQCAVTRKDIEYMKDVPYASAIGSIMYAMTCTRPDVAYALSMTSRHQASPGPEHWTAVKNILRYLNRTKNKFLVYGGQRELIAEGYTDASFMTDPDDRRSQSGYVFLLNGGAVSWRSWKQSTTADSTTSAEVMAAAEASKEGVWIKKFLEELGVVPSSEGPLELFCDNSASISQIKEPRSHHKTKYMDRKYFVTRDLIEEGKIALLWVDSNSNTADPFTKPLSQARSEVHYESMGLQDHGEWLES